MASDIATTTTAQEDSRRKHRRSPDDEPEESSKRRKHRHHHHRSRHHRHRSKKHEEETNNEDDESKRGEGDDINPPSTAASTLPPIGAVSAANLKPDYDMEEGEIVEDAEEVFADDEFEKKKEDAEEIEWVVQNLGVHAEGGASYLEAPMEVGPLEDSGGRSGRVSKTLGEDRSNVDFITDAILHKKEKKTNQAGNSSKSEDVVGPRNSNTEYYGIHFNRNLVRESRTKCNTVAHTVSHDSGHDNSRSRSRSHDSAGNRSRSRSVVKEVSQLEIMHDSWDDKIKVGRSRDHRRGSNDLGRDDQKECNASSSRHTERRDRDQSLEIWGGDREGREIYKDGERDKEREQDRSMDKDKGMKREREMSRGREKEREMSRVREKERERSRDWVKERESRDWEKERRSSRDRHIDRERSRESEHQMSMDKEMDLDRRREKERDSSRGRGIDKDRRRESERDRSRDRVRERGREKERDRDRDWTREREKDSGHDRHRDKGGDRASYMDYRYGEIEDRRERSRRNNLEKNHSSKNDSLKEGEDKRKRDEDEQEDYQEKISLQLAEQEEEDIDKIKEESRRRRQAILEKYKTQLQVQPHLKDAVKDERNVEQADQLTSTAVPEIFDVRYDGADVYVADPSFSVGKSPPQNGHSAFMQSSGAGGLGEGTPKSERSNDMFCDDIFGDSPAGVRKFAKGDGLAIEKSGLHDNWDDAEGYYSYRFGENLDGRYEITAAHGKGVFSNVVRAKDVKAGNGEPEEVAIKIIRNNETMYKAGQSELIILRKLVGADPENKRHCVRFLSNFKYRNHLCLVFESLHMNLREVLKKFGRNIGLKLTAVRAYSKQLFIALKHLRNCGVLHCDIKPDNMLVNEAKNVLKLCDFGSAMFAGKNEITPYLVSRFYRAPEIILGLPYDHPMDMWSVGCCLYELYTGKVLFPGPTNNDMLRLHMELKGPFPKKMLRKGGFIDQHFDPDLNFLATEEDPVTKKTVRRMIHNIKPKDIGTIITSSPGEDPKMLVNFKDLLDKIFVLDPEKRMTVSQALNHPFITELWIQFLAWLKLKWSV